MQSIADRKKKKQISVSKCFHIFIITVMTLFFHAIHHSLNTRRAEILASLYFIDSCYYFISTLSICFILLLPIISDVRTYVLSYCFSFSHFNDLLLDIFFLFFFRWVIFFFSIYFPFRSLLSCIWNSRHIYLRFNKTEWLHRISVKLCTRFGPVSSAIYNQIVAFLVVYSFYSFLCSFLFFLFILCSWSFLLVEIC